MYIKLSIFAEELIYIHHKLPNEVKLEENENKFKNTVFN